MTATLTWIVGEAVVDGYYRGPGEAPLVRLGGVLHAARGMAAVGRPFAVAYISPSYLDGQVERYALSLGATAVVKIGDVVGCPNVVIVGSPREEGPQGYEFLLREEQQCRLDLAPLNGVMGRGTDVLLFPGGFDLQQVLRLLGQLGASVFADAHHGPANLGEFAALGKPLAGLILSTSSQVFLVGHGADPARLRASTQGPIADCVLLKENRGGSRLYIGTEQIDVQAHARRVRHSVGVGDCFDAVWVAMREPHGDRAALAYASFLAAEYAATWEDRPFLASASGTLMIPADEIVALNGLRVPWERRSLFTVYLAAPDFEGVDRRPIERVIEALQYHNFSVRCPVRENGLVRPTDPAPRRLDVFQKDLSLLAGCRMVLAVLPYDDPGTLIEIGWAAAREIPVIVYDPYRRAENLMLTELPDLVSSDLDHLIVRVFEIAARAAL